MRATLDRFVINKIQLGYRADSHPLGQLATQKTCGAEQALECRLMIRIEGGKPDLGMFQIGSDINGGE